MNDPTHQTEGLLDQAPIQRLKTTLEVVIQDECCGAWMAINNTFTAKDDTWKESDSFWNGVLIQLGAYDEWKSNQALTDLFSEVRIKSGTNTLRSLSKTDFESGIYWINIVVWGFDDQRTPPIDVADFYKLYLHPLNLRSLHAYLHPLPGGITFWHPRAARTEVEGVAEPAESEGYHMVAGPAVDDDEHSKFTFFLSGPKIEVTVFKFPEVTLRDLLSPWRGPNLLRDVGDIEKDVYQADRVVVIGEGGPGHGGHDNPPQPPGG